MLIAFPTQPSRVAVPASPQHGWAAWAGSAFSLALLIAALFTLRNVDFAEVRQLLPTNPVFWLAFATAYLAGPLCDWVIYRRLWRIPASGIAAIMRKMIGNELLFGYAGELYFYTWARRTAMTSLPFGTIKDVSILSAMVGNGVTLIMLGLSWPLISSLNLGIDNRTLLLSLTIVLVTSSLVLFLGKKVFTLPRRKLLFIAAVHLTRVMIVVCAWAWAWHLALPDIAIQWWLVLMALRLFLSRLPLMPNVDLVFAGLAVFFIGHDAEIGMLMTMMASLILATHIVLGVCLVALEAVGWTKK